MSRKTWGWSNGGSAPARARPARIGGSRPAQSGTRTRWQTRRSRTSTTRTAPRGAGAGPCPTCGPPPFGHGPAASGPRQGFIVRPGDEGARHRAGPGADDGAALRLRGRRGQQGGAEVPHLRPAAVWSRSCGIGAPTRLHRTRGSPVTRFPPRRRRRCGSAPARPARPAGRRRGRRRGGRASAGGVVGAAWGESGRRPRRVARRARRHHVAARYAASAPARPARPAGRRRGRRRGGRASAGNGSRAILSLAGRARAPILALS
jgi:hypothetical protein